MGSGDPPAIGAPKEVKTPPRARVAAFSNFESESPAGPPESFGDWALGHPRVATAVGLYGPGGTAVAIRTDSAAATGRSAAFPSLSKAKDSRSNLDYAVASPTAERLYQAANLRGPSDPSHRCVFTLLNRLSRFSCHDDGLVFLRNVGLFGMELDDGEALQFWHAALLEADKVVKEHEKAISVAERRGSARHLAFAFVLVEFIGRFCCGRVPGRKVRRWRNYIASICSGSQHVWKRSHKSCSSKRERTVRDSAVMAVWCVGL